MDGDPQQPAPEAAFKTKLLKPRERFDDGRLDDVLRLRIALHFGSYHAEKYPQVRLQQRTKQILPSLENLGDQLILFAALAVVATDWRKSGRGVHERACGQSHSFPAVRSSPIRV